MDTYHHVEDFTPSNLVLALSPTLHQLSKQDLLELLGTPVRDPVLATGPKTTSAPEYVVEPADLAKLDPSYLTTSLRVIDFDQVFCFREPPPPGIPPNPGFGLGIPIVSLAPEAIIEGAAGPASDIWALGCTLFRMRAGMQLLGDWHFNTLAMFSRKFLTYWGRHRPSGPSCSSERTVGPSCRLGPEQTKTSRLKSMVMSRRIQMGT